MDFSFREDKINIQFPITPSTTAKDIFHKHVHVCIHTHLYNVLYTCTYDIKSIRAVEKRKQTCWKISEAKNDTNVYLSFSPPQLFQIGYAREANSLKMPMDTD
jgi:hypothetical protein